MNSSKDYIDKSILEVLERKIAFGLSLLVEKSGSSVKFINEYSKADSSDVSITCIANFENGHTLGSCDLLSNHENIDFFVNSLCKSFIEKIEDDNDLDEHSANLLLPYFAFFGSEKLNAKISSHAESIMYVCNKFVESKVKINKKNNEIINF